LRQVLFKKSFYFKVTKVQKLYKVQDLVNIMLTEIVSYVKSAFQQEDDPTNTYLRDASIHLKAIEKEMRLISFTGWNPWFFKRGLERIQKFNLQFYEKHPLSEDDKQLIVDNPDLSGYLSQKHKSKTVHSLDDIFSKEREELKGELQDLGAYDLLTKMYRQCFILDNSPEETIDIFFENDTMIDITYATSSDFKQITRLMYQEGIISENYCHQIIDQVLKEESEQRKMEPKEENKIIYLSSRRN